MTDEISAYLGGGEPTAYGEVMVTKAGDKWWAYHPAVRMFAVQGSTPKVAMQYLRAHLLDVQHCCEVAVDHLNESIEQVSK